MKIFQEKHNELLYKITQTAAAMWLGMQLTAGYVTAPILFRLLPKMQAGEIAGILFAITALCGLVIFGAAYAFFRRQLASLSWWILVLWLLLACNHLWLRRLSKHTSTD